MIFVWSANGGPLQYAIGLTLFALQLPLLLGINYEDALIPLLLLIGGFLLVLVVVIVVVGVVSFVFWPNDPSWQGMVQRSMNQIREVTARRWGGLMMDTGTHGPASRTILLALFGGVVMLSLLALLWGSDVLFLLVHILGIASMILSLRQWNNVNDDDITAAGGRRRRRGEEEQDEGTKLTEIVRVVQSMPIEEFVPDNELDKCSVSQLKQMLKVRHQGNANDSKNKKEPILCVVERQELEEEVRKVRNYSDSCCICCEEYKVGDPLRVLPKCKHEFHLECIDQWAYTFASRNKRKRDPSCPLCNTALK